MLRKIENRINVEENRKKNTVKSKMWNKWVFFVYSRYII